MKPFGGGPRCADSQSRSLRHPARPVFRRIPLRAKQVIHQGILNIDATRNFRREPRNGALLVSRCDCSKAVGTDLVDDYSVTFRRMQGWAPWEHKIPDGRVIPVRVYDSLRPRSQVDIGEAKHPKRVVRNSRPEEVTIYAV